MDIKSKVLHEVGYAPAGIITPEIRILFAGH